MLATELKQHRCLKIQLCEMSSLKNIILSVAAELTKIQLRYDSNMKKQVICEEYRLTHFIRHLHSCILLFKLSQFKIDKYLAKVGYTYNMRRLNLE